MKNLSVINNDQKIKNKLNKLNSGTNFCCTAAYKNAV